MLLELFLAVVRAVQRTHARLHALQLGSRTKDCTSRWSQKEVLEAGLTRLGILRRLEILLTGVTSLREASMIRN